MFNAFSMIQVVLSGVLQRFAGWLAQICDENSCMRGIFNSKFPPNVCECVDFRRKFVPTNLQTSVVRWQAAKIFDLQMRTQECNNKGVIPGIIAWQ